jgi:hypothetical protein
MKIAYQIGWKKSSGNKKGEGQIVQFYINDEEMTIEKDYGVYLTSLVETRRTGSVWFLRKDEVLPMDTLKLVVKTSLAGLGIDEKRTFEAIYYVDETAPVRELFFTGVGRGDYPLLKGRFLEITSFSEADKRQENVNNFLDDEF